MDNNYSLSDIAAASGNDMFGGNAWIMIILFALIFGINGNGFGGRGDYGQFATAASQQDILFSQKFADLDNKMDRGFTSLGNGISDATYALNEKTNSLQTVLGGAIANEGRSIQTQLCAINSNIDNKFAALEKSQLEQRIAEQAAQINQLQMAQAMCGVPKINPNMYGVYPYNAIGCGCNNV